jgi:flagellin-like protein
MLNKKKGLSTIVATILLIMLTVVAVTAIATFVVPFVKNNLYEGTECVDYKDYFSFNEDFDYNCWIYEDPPGIYRYGITVSAESASDDIEAEVKGFSLTFLSETGDSQAIEVYDGGPTGTADGEIRRIVSTYPLEIPENGGTRTYVYSSSQVFEFVKIYPNLNSGKTCPESDSLRILDETCDSGLDLDPPPPS